MSALDFTIKKDVSLSDIATLDGRVLPAVSSLSFLGIIFSSDRKWSLHFDKCIMKACKRLFIIRNLRRSGCPEKLMFAASSAFTRSLLLYGVV